MDGCVPVWSYEHVCLTTSLIILFFGLKTRSVSFVAAGVGSIAMRTDRCLFRRQCGVCTAARPWLLRVDQLVATWALVTTMTQSSSAILRRGASASFALFGVAMLMKPNPHWRNVHTCGHILVATSMLLSLGGVA